MAAQSVIKINADGSQQTYTGLAASAGTGSSGEFIIADANGKLDPTFLPNGVGADSVTATAGEALTAGDFVYFSGTGTVLKADANLNTKRARGYVIANVANAATATVYFDEANSVLTGLTAGSTYYLSDTVPGGVTLTPPSTNGTNKIVQELGFATSTTTIHVNIQRPVIR